MRAELSENAEISAGNLQNLPSRDELYIRQASNLLRGGLAFIWFWEGLVPKFLFIASRDVSLVAKSGLGEFAVSAIHLTGVVEILIGAALALGVGIRVVCAIQVLLLALFLMVLGATEPRLLVDPFAALSKIVPLAAAATALFVLEGTAGRRIARGLAFSRVTEAGAVWVYQTQARHLTGQKANLLATIADEEGEHAEQVEPLWRALGGRPAPTRVYAVGGWILGHLTGIAGWRTVRAFDAALERRGISVYQELVALLPPEQSGRVRALLAQEQSHLDQLLR
jgi:rubrerythrin